MADCAPSDDNGYRPPMLLGVDVGGTFTDAVLALDGRLITAKAPTTPGDQSEGVLAAIETALERAGAPARDIVEFAHGMTVATNALLEGRGRGRRSWPPRGLPTSSPWVARIGQSSTGSAPRAQRRSHRLSGASALRSG